MPITVNGSGTITGVSVGGLPDGIVDTDMIAADAVTSAKIGSKTFTSYAVICDQKDDSTDGGTFTQDAWQTRDLNTEIFDPDAIVSISSNQFTLAAGNYLIEWFAPAYRVNRHIARLQNITDGTTEQLAMAMYASNTDVDMNISTGFARVTITGSKTFEVQHRCQLTHATFGFGVATGMTGVNSRYTMVKILKEA